MKRTFVCMATLLFVAVFSAQAAVLWNGERTYSNGRALPIANDRIVIAAEKFAGIKVGDRLMFEFGNYAADPLTNQHIIRLSTPVTYASLNHNINVSEGDKKASVTIDETLRDKLMASGLVIGGTGFTMTSISVEAANGTLWEGLKVINNTGWTVGIVEAGAFAGIKEGDVLAITAEKTADDARCVLKERSTWKDLPSDVANGNAFSDFKAEETTLFTFTLNADAVTALKTNGLLVAGSKYNLLSVAVTSSTDIRKPSVGKSRDMAVYTLDGVKVADSIKASLRRGIYISGGKKFRIE